MRENYRASMFNDQDRPSNQGRCGGGRQYSSCNEKMAFERKDAEINDLKSRLQVEAAKNKALADAAHRQLVTRHNAQVEAIKLKVVRRKDQLAASKDLAKVQSVKLKKQENVVTNMSLAVKNVRRLNRKLTRKPQNCAPTFFLFGRKQKTCRRESKSSNQTSRPSIRNSTISHR